MFERFTDRARRVLVYAQEEARLLNHSFIGTEHILLGLLHDGEGVAAQALSELEISLEDVRERVEETIGLSGTVPTGSPPFTPRAKKVLELSLREALQLGRNYIGTEHVLLGIVREGEGVAAQALVSLGADLARVRQTVILLLSGYPGRESGGCCRTPRSKGCRLAPGDQGRTPPSGPGSWLARSAVVALLTVARSFRAPMRSSASTASANGPRRSRPARGTNGSSRTSS